jgi:hypothetical protein
MCEHRMSALRKVETLRDRKREMRYSRGWINRID